MKKSLLYSTIAIASTGLLLIGVHGVSAKSMNVKAGFKKVMSADISAMLGVSTEEIRDKGLHKVLEEKNIDPEEFHQDMTEMAIEHMQEEGLTQDQIDKKVAHHEEMREEHLQSLAKELGVTVAEVKTKGIRQILEDQGKTEAEIKEFLSQNRGHKGRGFLDTDCCMGMHHSQK